MKRSERILLCGRGSGVPAPILRGSPGAQRGRFICLLFLLLTAVSFRAFSQTIHEDAATNPGSLATQALLHLAPAASGETAARDNHGVAENEGKAQPLIVIGFVGGFARSDDQKHPEVQFAEYLRGQYSSSIDAEVFGNHDGKKALNRVLRLLGSEGSGALSPSEKKQARIILYGHSWGATETVVFARELGKLGIPVLLTIQVDSIAKPGRNDWTIPANVVSAINFYQSGGPLHGQTQIVAADPALTKIIGNLHMTYEDRSINCDNYPWYARTFNKPHHEIENDPRVWDRAASLVDSEVAGGTLAVHDLPAWKPLIK